MNVVENNFGLRFLDFIRMDEMDIHRYQPIAGSFAVVQYEGKYLICFNQRRNQWELPAGKREQGETPKACAIRELYEETGQKVTDLKFKGLMKIQKLEQNVVKYHPVYFTVVDKLHPFIENDETTQIGQWMPPEKIDLIDPIDFKLLDLLKGDV